MERAEEMNVDQKEYGTVGNISEQDEKEISLQDILYILRRRILWVLGTFVVVVAAVGVYLYLATPIYEATVTMRVEPTQSGFSLENMFTNTSGTSRIATEVELIKSRSNIVETINRLGLYEQYLAEHEWDEPPSINALVSRVRGSISVSTVRDTNIVSISVQNSNRNRAMDTANMLAMVYNDMLKGIAQNEFQTRRQFIEHQIPNLEAELAEAEQRLRMYKESEGLILLDEEARNLLQAVTAYDRQITPYRIQMDDADQSARELQNQILRLGGRYPSLAEVQQIGEVQDIMGQLRSLRLELSSATAQGAAQTGELRSSISARENRLNNLLVQQFSRSAQAAEDVPPGLYTELASLYTQSLLAETHILYLSSLRENYQSRIRALPQIEQRMLELTRDVRSKEGLYILLIEKLEETKITEAGIIGTAMIVDEAIPPTAPVAPNKRLILAVGALLGLFLGVLLAFLIETFDITLRDEDTIKRIIGDPVILGRIPRLVMTGDGNEFLSVYKYPTSPGAEAFKLISANILFSMVKPPKVIAVTSSEMGEGKTTITANIAVAMAQNGLKTIIVDVDMRRPKIEQMFGIDKNQGGVVSYMLQNKEISSLINKPYPDLPKLHVLPVGPLPPNPTSVLTSEKFRLMIDGLRKVYDRIVLDLPPILVASDALVCSRIADGAVLVVRAGTASKRGVSMAVESLRSSQTNLLGVVINDITADNRYGYYHYYYYYSSDNSGKQMNKRKAARAVRKAMKDERRKNSHAAKTIIADENEEKDRQNA